LATIVIAGVTGSAFASDDAGSRILYFEPLRLATPANPVQQKSSQTRELQFDAYGRRFVVTLQPNDKLSPLLQAESGSSDPDSGIELYRGQVNGVSGSWARISMLAGKIQGMLWDGADLKSTAAIMQAAASATRRLEISVLGDTLLLERFGTDTRARNEILQRLNNVDGIYSSQLGVQITVPSIDFGDSLSATTSPQSLLDELGDLRRRSPSLNARGLTYFFTGRDLDGTTVGIAYLGSVCDRQYGAGVAETRNRSVWTESLITAHEIGHNFGAPHDGHPEGACASTPQGTFLMSSSINGNDTFSSCSLSIMQPKAASASCITALTNADIAVDADLGSARQPLNSSFDWQLTVRNAGGLTTADARAEITLPSALTVEEAFVTGGTCISGGGLITCELGQVVGSNSAVVQLVLRTSVAASHPISVSVSAANESNLANNQGAGTIDTLPVAAQSRSSGGGGTTGPGLLALLLATLGLKNFQRRPLAR
jgi:hypothetical protein